MATLTGKTIATTYTSLLKLEGDSGSTVAGASGNAVQVKTGDDDATPLYLNTDRVGIGIASPDKPLHVWDGDAGSHTVDPNTNVLIEGDSSTYLEFAVPADQVSGIQFADPAGLPGSIVYSHGTDNLTLTAADDIILSCENVGIGTATPQSELQVVKLDGLPAIAITRRQDTITDNTEIGALNFSMERDDASDYDIGAAIRGIAAQSHSGGAFGTDLAFYTAHNTSSSLDHRMRITEAGHVGIGTDEPYQSGFDSGFRYLTISEATINKGSVLELYGNGNDGDDVTMGSVIFGDNSNTTGANSLICSIQGETVGTNATNGGGKLHFQTKPDNGSLAIAMTILGSGNVGIGTDSPVADSILHLKKTGLADGNSVNILVDGTGNSVQRKAEFGVWYESDATGGTNAPCGYYRLDTGNNTACYFWVEDDNTVKGSTTVGHIGTSGGVEIGGDLSSDERLKNISSDPFPYGLTEINQLTPIKYSMKSSKENIQKLGFGAQTTNPILPEVVKDSKQCIYGYEWEYDDDGNQIQQVAKGNAEDTGLVMSYIQIVPVLVKAIQELSVKVTALENA